MYKLVVLIVEKKRGGGAICFYFESPETSAGFCRFQLKIFSVPFRCRLFIAWSVCHAETTCKKRRSFTRTLEKPVHTVLDISCVCLSMLCRSVCHAQALYCSVLLDLVSDT